jgi:membrane protease YdiL (CAAX protease family)
MNLSRITSAPDLQSWLIERPRMTLAFYLLLLTAAEAVTTYVDAGIGMTLHAVMLILLLVHSALLSGSPLQPMLYALLLTPLIRLLSLSLPLNQFPVISWYLIVSLPLFAAAFVVMRLMGYSMGQVGFRIRLRAIPFEIIVIVFGLFFGIVEYLILSPDQIITWEGANRWQDLIFPALMIIIGTGFMEELIFRGIIQQSAEKLFGKGIAIIYAAVIFAILHIGWQSAVDVLFVFIAGAFWGWVFSHTRSIIGISLSHGLTNIILFLVLPALLPM